MVVPAAKCEGARAGHSGDGRGQRPSGGERLVEMGGGGEGVALVNNKLASPRHKEATVRHCTSSWGAPLTDLCGNGGADGTTGL